MKIQILDHGYVKLIRWWGSDEEIVETARMSTGKGFLGWGTGQSPGDEKLLRYLYINKHSTPFEFAGMTAEVQAPLMVFREWHRHRTQSYSERSARYAPLPDCNYMPSIERLMASNKSKNKQAGTLAGADELTLESAVEWQSELATAYEHCEGAYLSGLRRGVPKELARLAVPVGRYSTMRASTDLRNWLAFATLRSAEGAQQEIREYSDGIVSLLKMHFPRTIELFEEWGRGP